MELMDYEAASIGYIARLCMGLGTIPRYSLNSLLWRGEECIGLRVSGYDRPGKSFQGLVNHLIRYAPFIVGTDGIEHDLENARHVRAHSLQLFPQEKDRWITKEEACEITGRSPKTVDRWRYEGWVQVIDDEHGLLFSKNGIETVVAMMNSAKAKASEKARQNRW